MKKVFLAAITIALICMQTVSFSAITDEELQAESNSNASEIASKESENDDLVQQIADLNTDIESTRLEIAQLQQDIDQSNATVKSLNEDISESKEKLKSRICAIYMAGSASNIEILLGAQSFDDLLDKLEYVSVITKHDTAMIDTLSEQVNTNKQTQQALSESKKQLEEKSTALKTKLTSFEDVLQANKDRLNYLYAENQNISDMLSAENDPNYALLEQNIQSYYSRLTESSTERATTAPSNSTTGNSSSSKSSSSNKTTTQAPAIYPTQPPVTNNNSTNSSSSDNGSNNNTNNTISSSGYIWPVPGFYNLTSLWDEDRGESNHGALDIASGGIEGANVIAARAGTVWSANNDCIHNWGKDSSCGCGGGYGNYVMIDHGDGYMTVYAHMSSITVSVGDYVQAGQLLGFVGSTGYSTGAHLHFETRYDGVKYNPLDEYPNVSVTY